MSLRNPTKINSLLQNWPAGTVLLSSWLDEQGIPSQLRQQYVKMGWLDGFGRGAFVRANDAPDIMGGLYALQTQAGLPIHVGARTALGMLGFAHYLELNQHEVVLFGNRLAILPLWFKKHDWGVSPVLHNSDFLPADLGLVDLQRKQFTVKGSGRARAIMECLYLAPNNFDLVEAYHLMEGIGSIRPDAVQELLMACGSVKVTRLFLYLAEKAGHNWLKYIDLAALDLGRGKRSLEPGGTFIPKYNMTVPTELAQQ